MPTNNLAPATQLGPAQAVRVRASVGLKVGRASDVGRVRDHNEDVVLTLEISQLGDQASEPLGLFILADGMGGQQAGELASAMAARVAAYHLTSGILRSYLLNEPRDASQAPLSEVLVSAVEAANKAVHDQVPGGGSTLTCALVLRRRAYLAHVGDSRAYLWADDHLRRITKDHSLVDRLVELGQISSGEAQTHPQRNVLYRAVGQGEALEVDTYVEPLSERCRLLLCSDGLWGTTSEEQLVQVLGSAATPQEACDRLIEIANAAGGQDNITAVIVEP